MPAFSGTLNPNEIYTSLRNMIISQEVYADNVAGTYGDLCDKSRVDGSLYGDQKLFYATDVLHSHAWLGDAEAANLLAIHRAPDPEVQAIELNVFRQIDLTVDDYLSKRAWMNEGSFQNFNSVMLGWLEDTKRVYDSTTFNVYVGTAKSSANINTITVTPTAGTDTSSADLEGKNRLEAEAIAEALANLFVDLKDVNRSFNDYDFIRSYKMDDIIVVWNSKHLNKIKYIDLPTIFHKENLVPKFEEEVLPAKYFGDVIAAAHTVAVGEDYRAVEETEIVVSGVTYKLFAGEQFPVGASLTAGMAYQPNDKIICKVMHRRSVPFMSAFRVGTSFFNGKSLTTNHYLTWGHNTLEYLPNYPFIEVKMN